jgi:hypothetical protein
MAHFAELDNDNKVVRVIVVHNNELLVNGNELESKGIEFCQSLYGGTWIQTSYNNNIRYNYAGTGFTYDAVRDAFIAPEPDNATGFDEDTCRWIVPKSEL